MDKQSVIDFWFNDLGPSAWYQQVTFSPRFWIRPSPATCPLGPVLQADRYWSRHPTVAVEATESVRN